MPTSRRSWCKSSFGDVMSCPQTSMRPSLTVSSRSMQRKAVLLPEPFRPMMATTEPLSTLKDTPSSTRVAPKLFEIDSTLTICDMEFPFKAAAPDRQRVAQGEVQRGDEHEGDDGLEGGVVDDLA